MLQGRRGLRLRRRPGNRGLSTTQGPELPTLGDFGHAPAMLPARRVRTPPPPPPPRPCKSGRWFDRFLKGIPNGIDKGPPVEIAPDPLAEPTQFKSLPKPRQLTFAFRGKEDASSPRGRWHEPTARVRHLESFGAPDPQDSRSQPPPATSIWSQCSAPSHERLGDRGQ